MRKLLQGRCFSADWTLGSSDQLRTSAPVCIMISLTQTPPGPAGHAAVGSSSNAAHGHNSCNETLDPPLHLFTRSAILIVLKRPQTPWTKTPNCSGCATCRQRSESFHKSGWQHTHTNNSCIYCTECFESVTYDKSSSK